MRLKSLQRVVGLTAFCLPILSLVCLVCWTQIEKQYQLLPIEFRESISRHVTLRHGFDTMYLFELKSMKRKRVTSLVAMLRLKSCSPISVISFVKKGETDWWPDNMEKGYLTYGRDDRESEEYSSLWFDETNETAFIEIGR